MPSIFSEPEQTIQYDHDKNRRLYHTNTSTVTTTLTRNVGMSYQPIRGGPLRRCSPVGQRSQVDRCSLEDRRHLSGRELRADPAGLYLQSHLKTLRHQLHT